MLRYKPSEYILKKKKTNKRKTVKPSKELAMVEFPPSC